MKRLLITASLSLGRGRRMYRRSAFTLVELLRVIGIIVVLTAVLLPVLAAARRQAYESSCLSNLRQIGISIHAYASDYDDLFPRGADPADLYSEGPVTLYSEEAKKLPWVNEMLLPYIQDRKIQHCPADTGFLKTGRGESISFDTLPSSYDRYGTSYYYYTLPGLLGRSMSPPLLWSNETPSRELSASQILLFQDGSGRWYGAGGKELRYCVVYADGHAKVLPGQDFNLLFDVYVERPDR